jgi:hypothetical protein
MLKFSKRPSQTGESEESSDKQSENKAQNLPTEVIEVKEVEESLISSELEEDVTYLDSLNWKFKKEDGDATSVEAREDTSYDMEAPNTVDDTLNQYDDELADKSVFKAEPPPLLNASIVIDVDEAESQI